jgi:hypothetical protein
MLPPVTCDTSDAIARLVADERSIPVRPVAATSALVSAGEWTAPAIDERARS